MSNLGDIAIEFPRYPVAQLPAIPDRWMPHHWHNEACPCWEAITGSGTVVYVYVDYPEQADRDWLDASPRFSVHSDNELVFASDDWAEVIAYVEGH